MNRIHKLILAVALALGEGLAAAQSTVTYVLDQNDIGLPAPARYFDVVLSSSVAGTVNVTVTPVYPGFVAGTNYGAMSFGFDLSSPALATVTANLATDITGLPAGWTASGAGNQNGYGQYDFVLSTTGSGRAPTLSFAVSGLGGTSASDLADFAVLSTGGSPEFFAVHLAGFTLAGNPATSGYFAGQALAVPEPSSWALMLAGLGLAGSMARRRRAGSGADPGPSHEGGRRDDQYRRRGGAEGPLDSI